MKEPANTERLGRSTRESRRVLLPMIVMIGMMLAPGAFLDWPLTLDLVWVVLIGAAWTGIVAWGNFRGRGRDPVEA